MLYISRKKSVTNPEGIGGKSNKIDECNSCIQQTTAEIVAKETGVSPRTIAKEHGVRGAEKSGNSCHSLENDQRAATQKSKVATVATLLNLKHHHRPVDTKHFV